MIDHSDVAAMLFRCLTRMRYQNNILIDHYLLLSHNMKITQIDCHVLLDPGYDVGATSSSQDALGVEIHTDEGLTGIGERDANPWIGRACINAPGTHTMGFGLAEMLIGQNPLQPEELWEKLYVGSAMNGRR